MSLDICLRSQVAYPDQLCLHDEPHVSVLTWNLVPGLVSSDLGIFLVPQVCWLWPCMSPQITRCIFPDLAWLSNSQFSTLTRDVSLFPKMCLLWPRMLELVTKRMWPPADAWATPGNWRLVTLPTPHSLACTFCSPSLLCSQKLPQGHSLRLWCGVETI